jgi:dUTPase
MKKIHFSLIFIFFALFFNIFVSKSYAGVKQKEVIVAGSGVTEPDALNDALIHAVSQVSGLAINSSQVLDIKKKIEDGKKSSSRDIQKNIQTYTKGIISSYDILSSDKTKEGLVNLKIKAVVPVYDPGNQINRLRLAIVPFRISEKITNKIASQDYSSSWNNALEEGLVQSRRFAMVDRTYSNETNQELTQYMDQGFSISELARLGQKIGTDYLVVGEVKKYSVTDKSVSNPLDDTRISRSSLNTEISLRLIDVATSQIKFAKSYTSSNSAISDIINAIYPMVILSVQDGFVTIGSGGSSLKIGQHFRAMGLGQELKDPYTGESLGKQESYIGEIEITDVQFKTSQAKIVKGQDKIIESFPNGLIIRPLINNQQSSNPKKTKEKTSKKTEGSSDQDW